MGKCKYGCIMQVGRDDKPCFYCGKLSKFSDNTSGQDICNEETCSMYELKEDWNSVQCLCARIIELTGCDHVEIVNRK